MEASDTGGPISVPVGPEVLGRLFNVIGETIDGKEPVVTEPEAPYTNLRQASRSRIHLRRYLKQVLR